MNHVRFLQAVTIVGCTALAHASNSGSCGNSSGNTPLNDLGAGTYLGYQGGLYPGGANVPPPAHLTSALALANQIEPLDASGSADPGCGLIGMISIGMSNTTHEFAVFERQEDANTARNPRVVLITCSQGGQSAELMNSPTDPYWTLVDQRVAAAGLSNDQVQVAWIKQALGNETHTFPADALTLQADLVSIVQTLHDKFPNLRLCYCSSRIYGGYNTGHNEPVSYESGFAFKWLIEDQIGGSPQLNWDASAGPVEAPLLLWGPYLWADGENPRSDGLTWCLTDLESDGTHPSPSGEQKVANLLSAFFASDATAQPWYANNAALDPLVAIAADADATVRSSQPNTNFGADTTLRVEGQTQIQRAYLRFDFSAIQRPVVHAKLALRNPEQPDGNGPINVRVVANTGWNESMITFSNAPPASGATLTMPLLSRDGARSLDVTDWVNADVDGVLSLAMTPMVATQPETIVRSREDGWAPRLVLTLNPGAVTSYCTSGTTSNGCLAAMSASGMPSIALTSGFVLTTSNVEGQKTGLVFYGLNGRHSATWGTGYLCVKAPLQRTPVASSNGTNGACNGSIALDWLAYVAAHPTALGAPFGVGQLVDTQCWFRDPPSAKTTAMSNALEFYTCP